jgi:two-component system, chemotaxis family, response regulator Rcp1
MLRFAGSAKPGVPTAAISIQQTKEREQMYDRHRIAPVEILLVEDNPADVRLTKEALKEDKLHNNLNVVKDGVEALAYLRREGHFEKAVRPDLILLDLNLPKKDGREVLKEIKEDEDLRCIPVVVLTVSEAEGDILRSYDLHANCYITKPLDLNQFSKVVKSIQDFWLTIVKLPIR